MRAARPIRQLRTRWPNSTVTDRPEVRLFTHVMMTDNIAYYGRRGYVETHRLTEREFSRAFFSKRLDGGATAQR